MTPAPQRPTPLPVLPDGIPAALKGRAQWVCWDYEWRGEKWTKVPLCVATDRPADSTDPATWATFAAALKAYQGRGYAGVGFVFAPDDPFCGIDIDHCIEAGADSPPMDTAVRTILAELDSYAEETPSGTGIHIIVRAALPGGKGRKNTKQGIELYDRARFFTLTGAALLGPDEPQERQAALDDLYVRLFPVRPVGDDAPPQRPQGGRPADDQLLIDRAHRAKNGVLFARLWRGDTGGYGGDDSSADLALCNLLAFWCGGPDADRIDRLFRQSGLFRTKWERADYRAATIGKALAGRTAYCDWGRGAAPDGEDDGASFAVGADNDGDGGAANGEPTATTSTNPNDYPHTDTGNVNLYAALYAGELRHDWRRQSWYRWSGHWWEADTDGYALHLTETIGTLRQRAAAEIADEDDRKAARRWAQTCHSGKAREMILRLARARPQIKTSGEHWDADPDLLGVANGVVDLRTGALHPGSPLDLITLHTTVTYDPNAAAPRWARFLAEVFRDDDELIGYVRRFAGYSLTGDTGEHKLLICWGKGSNGKSTLLNTLAYVAGEYAYTMPFSTLEARRDPGGPTNDLAALVGRRLVVSSEVNEGQPLNEARIKALTGGDPVTARFLNKEFFTFRPAAKFWLAVNHKPPVRDDSRGLWRRIDMLPFLASFDGNPDRHLEETLRAEAPGILAWMVRGCLEWRANGLRSPEIVAEATREYQRESDPLAAFLTACCVEGAQQAARGNVLYLAYLEWATSEGLKEREVLSRQRFGRLLGDRYDKLHDRQGTVYKGIGLDPARENTTKDRAQYTM